MTHPLKYAHVERERRFLVRSVPEGVSEHVRIVDAYITGTRMRLREMTWPDGKRVRKLGHKVRLAGGAREVACTSMYLDDAEWVLLASLPATTLTKVRHIVERDGWRIAVDEFDDGTLLAEIDDGESPSSAVPVWLDVIRDVTDDERWVGVSLAR